MAAAFFWSLIKDRKAAHKNLFVIQKQKFLRTVYVIVCLEHNFQGTQVQQFHVFYKNNVI